MFSNNGTEQYFNCLIKAIRDFRKLSGLHRISNIMIVLRIGSLRHTYLLFANPTTFQWSSQSTNSLGVYFTNDENMIVN